MKHIAMIGAVIFGLMAVNAMGISAITCAIMAAGLFVSAAIVHTGEKLDQQKPVVSDADWGGAGPRPTAPAE
jgi:hypothetical protein